MAQVDREGNVNVSKFGPKLAGAGGFINISQSAKAVVFVGTFTAGKCCMEVAGGCLHIAEDGSGAKFVEQVEHRTFSGSYAAAKGQPVLYVTERCVFQLRTGGLELIEIAPGVDLERDILAHMAFRPIMEQPPRLMDPRIFKSERMGVRQDVLGIPMDERLAYDPRENLFFVNFERLSIDTPEEIEAIRNLVAARLGHLGHKVAAIVNYDNFHIAPELTGHYLDMVRDVVERFYSDVTRYTTSTFLRLKLGRALTQRHVAPHIYESEAEARARLIGGDG